ncbi:hypothetical protein NQ176_g5486 [Zarea fungicola]|uniref:Uncharacterized protein n=1 Tax=Zarea fungicola TaxID=93591 RepID=A0ACC1N872_9HYPO|nr:hypothetical protein NQ176_g5486 [Lecanicillium fungicola]
MVVSLLAFGLYALAALPSVSTTANTPYCSVFETVGSTAECRSLPSNFLSSREASTSSSTATIKSATPDINILQNTFKALADLQNDYFNQAHNTWPDAIDWTAAVIQTIVTATMSTLTQSLDAAVPGQDWKQKENLLSFLHEQIVSSYFGQQADRILDEAFDDVLWVVLAWMEAIKFRRLHEELHYPNGGFGDKHIPTDLTQAIKVTPWHGQVWVDTFAQRASDFWDYSTQGWDTSLCHGGMTWNPRLETYKNAVTNELYIAGSISMYQNFPGTSLNGSDSHDPRQLQAAKDGYAWLMNVNMTNSQGLFVDGFHINHNIPGNVECDVRDEMVYTYNQGIILSGSRGLFGVTGDASYVEDGHKFVKSVIAATGWDLRSGEPVDTLTSGTLPPWRGIGRYGILEEQCDASGTCSQDSQTFKGIYFHHLTAFCRPLDLGPGRGHGQQAGVPPGTYHFGHTADPVYMGSCNGVTASCSFAGYALETQCHTGYECVYDVVADKGWRVGIGTHKIRSVISDVLLKYDEVPKCVKTPKCRDCGQWKMYESNGTETTTTPVTSTSTRTRTRTSTCKTPGWWGCLDETTDPATPPPTSAPITTTTTSTCKTPGWFGCKDKTTPTAEPTPTTTTTSCESPGRFWGCNDPTDVTSIVTSTPTMTITTPPVTANPTATTTSTAPTSTTAPGKGKCLRRNWIGLCKEWENEPKTDGDDESDDDEKPGEDDEPAEDDKTGKDDPMIEL